MSKELTDPTTIGCHRDIGDAGIWGRLVPRDFVLPLGLMGLEQLAGLNVEISGELPCSSEFNQRLQTYMNCWKVGFERYEMLGGRGDLPDVAQRLISSAKDRRAREIAREFAKRMRYDFHAADSMGELIREKEPAVVARVCLETAVYYWEKRNTTRVVPDLNCLTWGNIASVGCGPYLIKGDYGRYSQDWLGRATHFARKAVDSDVGVDGKAVARN